MGRAKQKKKKVREKEPAITEEEFRNSPRGKFLKVLAKTWKTPDNSYFFYHNGATTVEESEVLAVIVLDTPLNQHFGKRWSLLNSIHIRSIGVSNHARQTGIFNTVCLTLLDIAEYTGVFVFGTSKPFAYDIPLMKQTEDAYHFMENEYKQADVMRRSQETDKRALALKAKYLELGFCSYDAGGYSCSDSFWKKKASFGFFGRQPEGELEEHYFAKHLSCC